MPVLRSLSPSALLGSGLLALTTVTVVVSAPPPASASTAGSTIRINAGGPAGTFEGVAWQADRWYDGGRTSWSHDAVGGTTSSELFQSRRIAPDGYDIPVADGTYEVTLLTAETWFTSSGERRMSASAEGVDLLTDVDLHATVGHDRAHRVTGEVTVTDGTLDLDLAASVNNAVVAGIVVEPVDGPGADPTPDPDPDPTPDPAPPSSPSGPSWTAPRLEDPLVWSPSSTDRQLVAPADRDVLVRWPRGDVDAPGGFHIHGGRNVVSVGGTVRLSQRAPAGTLDDAERNRCLHITGHGSAQRPRTVHVEGLHCAGQSLWEGITIDSKGERGSLTVQLRDIRIDEIRVDWLRGQHKGGDALHTWNGPHRLLVDGFEARNLRYQGFFLQPYAHGKGALGRWELHDVTLEGHRDGSAYLMWLAGSRTGPGAVPLTVSDVWVQPSPGRSADRTLWERDRDWYDVQVGRPPA